jgi:heme/copper-type cytochrome/quinol oxidase subunit 1
MVTLVVGATSVFYGMHAAGVLGLPRRMPDSPDVYLHAPRSHSNTLVHPYILSISTSYDASPRVEVGVLHRGILYYGEY